MKNRSTNSNNIKKLILGQTIIIKYQDNKDSIIATGMIIKIDKLANLLYLPNIIIPFDNIINVTPLNYN